MSRCVAHPVYRATRPPTVDCELCRMLWAAVPRTARMRRVVPKALFPTKGDAADAFATIAVGEGLECVGAPVSRRGLAGTPGWWEQELRKAAGEPAP